MALSKHQELAVYDSYPELGCATLAGTIESRTRPIFVYAEAQKQAGKAHAIHIYSQVLPGSSKQLGRFVGFKFYSEGNYPKLKVTDSPDAMTMNSHNVKMTDKVEEVSEPGVEDAYGAEGESYGLEAITWHRE